MARERTCALCLLVVSTVLATVQRDFGGQVIPTVESRKLCTDNWYLTPFRYRPHLYAQGYQLFLRQGIETHAQSCAPLPDDPRPSWPYVLRLIGDMPRGGRRIDVDHLDYGWIARTVALCEISTDMPPRKFDVPLRVLDCSEMCIKTLSDKEDYVALSYTWGNVDTVKLSLQNLSALSTARSLKWLVNIPQTIRDAIELVRRVGQRYLWVDCLCIVQNNPVDLQGQLKQMGEVYRFAYFTIFAVSGKDANYGLPGVRPGSSQARQFVCRVGRLEMSNSLPWMEERLGQLGGTWSSRAWTYQEKFHSQRALYIGDTGMFFQCVHTSSPNDEHCFHSRGRDVPDMIATGNMFFFDAMDQRSQPYIGDPTSFDMHSLFIRTYTGRQLTYQADAERAFLGIIRTLESRYGCEYIHGLPEAEFDAALLWSPIGGGHTRRCDPSTGKPLFPSWSWLGWIGQSTYPWTLERDTFMSIENSPLEWQDAGTASGIPSLADFDPVAEAMTDGPGWFTADDLCLPRSPERRVLIHAILKGKPDHLGARAVCNGLRTSRSQTLNRFQIDWPELKAPQLRYMRPDSHHPRLKTLTNDFAVIGKPWKRPRPWDTTQTIWRLSVIDRDKYLVGYIDVPSPDSGRQIQLGYREFIVLSRSTINGKYEPRPDRIHHPQIAHTQEFSTSELFHAESTVPKTSPAMTHPIGNFDKSKYQEDRPWCMFNVMMLDRSPGWASSACRDAIGRIHVDAFLRPMPWMAEIDLE